MTHNKMNPEVKAKWLKHLRSGWYKQGQFVLRNRDDSFCCLGVLCNVHAIDHPETAATQIDSRSYLGRNDFLADPVKKWSGLTNGLTETTLSVMNDNCKSFKEIANWIEKNL